MPEVIIKYKTEKALKALHDLAKLFDMSIKTSPTNSSTNDMNMYQGLPITFAENPDVTALAGIWEGKDITLEQLRRDAWGNRHSFLNLKQ
jgi:hypothetical protein